MKKFLLPIVALAIGMTAYAGTVEFNFTEGNNYTLPAYDPDDTPYAPNEAVVTVGDVKITFSYNPVEGEDGGWRMWNDGLRAYYKRTPYFTVTTTNGEPVTKVSWTVVSGATFALKGTTDNITNWVGEESSVTFEYTAKENKAVKTITVIYGEAAEKDPEPVIPTIPSTTISVSEALQLLSAGATGKATVEGVITSITEVSEQYANATYYIADRFTEGNTNKASTIQVFRGKYLDGADFTSASQIELGARVVVTGDLVLYGSAEIPEFSAGNYIVSYLSKEAGVESIGIDLNAPVEYFNLQGVRVNNPENGVFIMRQGSKTVKVVR